jgi:hypothetical protein
MTDWTPQDDWSQVKVGDTVRATRNDDAITYEVVDKYIAITGDAPYALVVRPVGLTWQTRLDRNVWSLSVPAKPAVELPTEVGHYEDMSGRHWLHQIHDGASYGCPDRDVDQWVNAAGHVAIPEPAVLPLSKLEPVAVTAKKVLDRVHEVWRESFISVPDALSQVLVEFGVSE